MNIDVKMWGGVPSDQMKELFLENPYPLYRGTPLGSDLMKEYMFMLAGSAALTNKDNTLVVAVDGVPAITGQFYLVPYLSKYWNVPIGSLGHIVSRKVSTDVADVFTSCLTNLASGVHFVSVTIPGPDITLIRSFEKQGFVYAEGFINMIGSTNYFRNQFILPGLKIREPIEGDFNEIDEAWRKTPFPSRFVSDGGFDPEKARELYVHRFREVHEQRLGKVFVAELEGKFVGALIGIVNEDMTKAIGVKTNMLSGMGIIIHPRAARRGVSMHMIEHRQDWYKSEGVEYVSFGANFNNKPMILGLGKLGLKYGSLDVTLHRWFNRI